MQITVERDAIQSVLARATRVAEKRNTIPVLAHIRLAAEGEKVTVTATDLDIEAVQSARAEIGKPGTLLLPAHTLHDIVRKVPAGATLRIEGEQGRAVLRAGRSRFTLPILAPEDFPEFTSKEGGEIGHAFTLDAAAFRATIERVQFAISTEETRYYLNGIYMHAHAGEEGPTLRLVATDGPRLSLASLPLPAGAGGLAGVIIPRKTVGEIVNLLRDASGEVALTLTHHRITVEYGGARLSSKLIDGTFPDYGRVIPSGGPLKASLSAPALAAAVDRVSTVSAERGRAVKFEFGGEGEAQALTLSVVNPETGEANEVVDLAGWEGDPILIGFNAKYVGEALANIGGDAIEILLTDPGSPALWRVEGATDALVVLMPMRV